MRHLLVFDDPPSAAARLAALAPAVPSALAEELLRVGIAEAAASLGALRAERVWLRAASDGVVPQGFRPRALVGDDLGARLQHAFAESFAAGAERVLVVCADALALDAARVEAAYELLDRFDVVAGPCPGCAVPDGRFWCVGLRKPAPDVLQALPWGTPTVFALLLARASHAGLSVTLARPLDRLERPVDLGRVVGAIAAGRASCGPDARNVLEAAGLVPAWLPGFSG